MYCNSVVNMKINVNMNFVYRKHKNIFKLQIINDS
jgi:hypothetical protein